jgi:hypothetical protein
VTIAGEGRSAREGSDNNTTTASNTADNISSKMDPKHLEMERCLKVERLNFLMVPSTLVLMQIASEYLMLCRCVPSVAVEAVQRLSHLFRLFNRQMQQLVLQGEARTNGVLKKKKTKP